MGQETGADRNKLADSSKIASPHAEQYSTRPQAQPHEAASHLTKEEGPDSDASHPKQSTARGRINKNQDYNAAATTTAGTAAARARLCAEPSAQVNSAIAPAWCAAASSIGTT